jgi:hypothetical protein
LQRANSSFAVIGRVELVPVQQVGQLACIDAVALVPGFYQRVLAWITDQHLGNLRLPQIV